MNRSKDPLLSLVESYFTHHLRRVRGASPHTVRAYRDALKLFFVFVAEQTRRPVSSLRLDDVTVDHVLAFLDHVEAKRGVSVATRNGCRSRIARSRGLPSGIVSTRRRWDGCEA